VNVKGRLEPPGGQAAPTSIRLGEGGESLESEPLAKEICRRYRLEFPDEEERYGAAGTAWCVHDNLYLLYWAAETANGYDDMQREVTWLAEVLESRDFPLKRLARNLDIGADVIRDRVPGVAGDRLSPVFEEAATFVRSRSTFLE
jgi:hypothetical protein